MDSRMLAAIAVTALILTGAGVYLLTSAGGEDDPVDTTGMVEDAVGRFVPVPESLDDGIVTVGASTPLRFLSMFDAYDLIIEVDEEETDTNHSGRAYSYAYPYTDITDVHSNRALDASTAESISLKSPSLVIVQENVWNAYKENCRYLARSCNLVVVGDMSITAPLWDDDGKVTGGFLHTVNLIGTLLGKEERAQEIIAEMEAAYSDLQSLAGESDTDVYVAGVSISGTNALNTTFPRYMPFDIIGVSNAYKGKAISEKAELNIEEFPLMDIDMIILDPASSDKIGEKQSQLFLEYVYRTNNDEDPANDIPIYVTIPIVRTGMNYDCMLAGTYYVAHLVYGTLSHEEVVDRINGIFTSFYGDNGADVLGDMSALFDQTSGSNGVELPLLGEVEVVKHGNRYGFAAV